MSPRTSTFSCSTRASSPRCHPFYRKEYINSPSLQKWRSQLWELEPLEVQITKKLCSDTFRSWVVIFGRRRSMSRTS